MTTPNKKPLLRRDRRPREAKRTDTAYECPCCRRTVAFCWKCKCGFMMCQDCMLENTWGLTCNHVTWTCPDCGELRSY